jgi:enoyl-CoA hydratase
MAADLGTLQIFPKRVGNESTFRELAYTGRNMGAEEALRIGLVSRVFEDRTQLEAGLLESARVIASKSPVGVHTIKQVIKRG